jgi:hypothetical protein
VDAMSIAEGVINELKMADVLTFLTSCSASR